MHVSVLIAVVDRTTEHALKVVNGELGRVVGETERQACERHLRDLERQGTEDFPYVWDVEAAQDLIEFAETLTLAEGMEPRPLELYSFQAFILGNWNGWKTLRGHRRFRTSYAQLGRQNGKSLLNAVPSMYYGNFSGYMYPQVYATATKQDQAWIVAMECKKFIDSDPELSGTRYEDGLFTVKEYNKRIECNLSKGAIVALGRDTKTIDGFRPYFGSVDEYHLHPTNQMYKLLSDGTRRLPESLISVITTAGFDLNVPCYKLYQYCKTVLSGAYQDETQFVYICELDEDDDVWDEANWPKANPLWNEDILESMRADAIKAKPMQGEELRNFLTKALNKWVQFTENQYMNMNHWAKCGSSTTIEDMAGRECYLGLDLSSGGDLTSGGLIFPLELEGKRKYYVHSHSFIPAARVAEHIKTDDAPYDMWIKQKLLTTTETLGGVKTDYKYIIRYYTELIEKYDLKLMGIGYDPHNADAFLHDLSEFGVPVIEIRQSARSLNDATVDFALEVEAGNVIYDKSNELLTWSMVNAKTESNSFGEIKLIKGNKTKRIDPVDAVINAHKITLSLAEEIVDYQEVTDDYLEMMGW